MTEKLSDKFPAYQVASNLDVSTAREALQAAAIFDQNHGNGSSGRAEWTVRFGSRCLEEILSLRSASTTQPAASPRPAADDAVREALREIEAISDRCVNEEYYTSKMALDDISNIRSVIKRAARALASQDDGEER